MIHLLGYPLLLLRLLAIPRFLQFPLHREIPNPVLLLEIPPRIFPFLRKVSIFSTLHTLEVYR